MNAVNGLVATDRLTADAVAVTLTAIERERDAVVLTRPIDSELAVVLVDAVIALRKLHARLEILESNDLIRYAIDEAGREAAQASMDAHGCKVLPGEAWDFITTLWWESEDRRAVYLPEEMPDEFVTAYQDYVVPVAEPEKESRQPISASEYGMGRVADDAEDTRGRR